MQKLLFKWQPSSIQAPNWEMMHTLWFTITRFCFNKKLISNYLKHCLKLLYRITEWFPTRFLWGCALWERGISLRIKLMKGEEQSVLLALLGGAFWSPFVFRMETFSPGLPQWEMSCLVTPHWLGAVVLRAIPRRSCMWMRWLSAAPHSEDFACTESSKWVSKNSRAPGIVAHLFVLQSVTFFLFSHI